MIIFDNITLFINHHHSYQIVRGLFDSNLYRMGLSAIVKELQAAIAVKIFDWVSKKPTMTKNEIQNWLYKAFHSHSMDDGREIVSYAKLLVTGSPCFENLYKESVSIVTH